MSNIKTYPGVDEQKLDRILALLASNGYEVSGDNPYTVHAKKGFVKVEINADWDAAASALTLTIIKPAAFHDQIWSAIDKEIGKV